MNRIATMLAALLVPLATVTALPASPAAADTYTRICYADPAVLVHSPAVLEAGDSDAYLNGMIVRPFPDGAIGCKAYDGVPLDPSYETLYVSHSTAAAAAPACTPTATDPTAALKAVRLERKVSRQAATIARLRARLAHR